MTIGLSSGADLLRERSPNDGSGRVKMDAGRLRTRGHIDVGHRPEVPVGDGRGVDVTARYPAK
jgi:hypothetical protein